MKPIIGAGLLLAAVQMAMALGTAPARAQSDGNPASPAPKAEAAPELRPISGPAPAPATPQGGGSLQGFGQGSGLGSGLIENGNALLGIHPRPVMPAQ